MAEIVKCEQELSELSNRFLSGRGDSITQRVKGIREFALGRLAEVRGLLGADAIHAKAEIAKHVQAITLKPDGQAYQASSDWDLLGTARMEDAGES